MNKETGEKHSKLIWRSIKKTVTGTGSSGEEKGETDGWNYNGIGWSLSFNISYY